MKETIKLPEPPKKKTGKGISWNPVRILFVASLVCFLLTVFLSLFLKEQIEEYNNGESQSG